MSENSVTACKCGCGKDNVRPDVGLFARYLVGRGYCVSSSVRCSAHNARVLGSPRSRHLSGDALDLHPPQGDQWMKIWLGLIVASNPDVLLRYSWGYHLDWRLGTPVGDAGQ